MHFLLFAFCVIIGIAASGKAKTNSKLEQEFNLMKKEMNSNKMKMNNMKMEMNSNKMEMNNMKMEMNSNKMEINNMKQLIMKLGNNNVKIKNMDYEMNNIETEMDNIQSKIKKTDGKTIKKLQTVGFHSFFCAYQNQWNTIGDMTYTDLLLAESNIGPRPAEAFDIATGQFTARRTGVYRVDVFIGQMLSSSPSVDNEVSIQLNGVDVLGSGFASQIFTQVYSGESGGRSMLIRMNEGNVLTVHVSSSDELLDITFCISFAI